MNLDSIYRHLFEQEEQQELEKVGADLEAAFKGGPEGVRTFMDSQKGKSDAVRDALVKAAEEHDGAAGDEATVKVSSAADMPISGFKPTQQFIDLMQSVGFPLGSAAALDKMVTSKKSGAPGSISVSGDVVLDGHHRWSGTWAIAPDGVVSAKNFSFPGNVQQKLAGAQMAVAAVDPDPTDAHPSKGGGAATDIIGKGSIEIFAMIDANKGKQTDPHAPGPLLNDEMIQGIANGKFPAVLAWAGLPEEGNEFVQLTDVAPGFENDPVRKAIAQKVADNLDSLPDPAAGAPESREDMPQFDHESIGGDAGLGEIEAGLKAGELNVVPPFQKETTVHDTNNMIIERWQKLAGLNLSHESRLLREQAEEENPDVEAVEGVWSGGPNLVIDGESDPGWDEDSQKPSPREKEIVKTAVKEPESSPPAAAVLNKESHHPGRLQVYRGSNDVGRTYKLPAIIFEHYFDAMVTGNVNRASVVLEEHLDARYPGWVDYEWRD